MDEKNSSNPYGPTSVIEPNNVGTVQDAPIQRSNSNATEMYTGPVTNSSNYGANSPLKDQVEQISSPYESLDGGPEVTTSLVSAPTVRGNSTSPTQSAPLGDASQTKAPVFRDKDTNKLLFRLIAGASVVFFVLFGAGMISSRLSNNRPVDPVAQLEEQEISGLTDQQSTLGVQTSGSTLLVNGNVLATDSLQVSSGGVIGSIVLTEGSDSQTYTLPNSSGVFCLDTNNCNYLQRADVITTSIGGVNGALSLGDGLTIDGSTIVNTLVQTSLNGSAGSIVIQGTTNQVGVSKNGNIITLTSPQDIGLESSPTFSSITLSGIGTQNGNVLCDISNNCGYAGGTGAYIQDGNSFGAAAVLGTNDNFSLAFETNGITQATLAVGGAFTLQNSVDTTSGFRVMDADGGNPVLNVDTTNERVGIGTAAPSVELDVVGDTVISNHLQVGPTGNNIDECSTVFFGTIGCDVGLDVANTSTATNSVTYGIYNNVSITPTGLNFATNYGSSNTLFLGGTNNFTENNIGISGSVVATNTAGTISRIIGMDAAAVILTTTSTATVSEAIGMQAGIGVLSDVSGGTITTGYGLQVSAASVSGAGASIGTNYGIYVNPQTAGAADYGVAIGAADTQTLWLSSNADNTTASAGIAFGSSRDTNLYRSAANTLRTDDALSVGDDITVTGDILPSADDTYDLGSNSNRWRDLYLGPATLSIGTSTADYKISYDTGGNALLFNNDQEDRDFRIAGDTQANLLYVDAGNNRIGIGTNTPGYELDVVGTINASTSLYVGGTQVCTIGGCTAASGSGNYIQNGTALQTANFNIQSAGAASVGAIVRGAASQTAAIQEWQSSAGTVLARITASGFMQFDSSKGITGTAGDSYLYIGDTARAGGAGGKNLYYASAYYGGYGHEFYGGSATNMLGVMLITSSQASKIGLTVKGAASQTGNLQEWQNSSGTAISSVSASGAWNVGASLNIGGITGNAGTLQFFNSGVSLVRSANSGLTINTSGFGYGGGTTITNTASSGVKLTVQGAAGQTANLLEWTNSANTVLASIESTGSLYSPTAPIKLGYGVALQGESSSGGGFVDLIKRGSGNDVYVGSTSRDVIVQGNVYASMTVDGGANGIRLYSTDVTKVGSIGNLGSVSNPWNSLWLQPINATNVAARIRGQAGQSANLQEWQNSAGTVMSAIAGDGDIVSTEQISIGNLTPISGVRLSVHTYTNVKGLVVRGSGSQTANLQEWQSNTGTVLASVSATGAGSFVSLTQNGNNVCDISNNCSYAAVSGSTNYIQNGTSIQSGANLAIQSASAGSIGAVVRGAASQTANLQEWQNSSGTVLASVSASGRLGIGTAASSLITARSGAGVTDQSGSLIVDNETNNTMGRFYIGSGLYQASAAREFTLGVNSSILSMLYMGGDFRLGTRSGGSAINFINSDATVASISGGVLRVNSSGTAGTVEKFRVNTPTTVDNLAAAILSTGATTSKGLVVQGAASQTANLQEWQDSTGAKRLHVSIAGGIPELQIGNVQENAVFKMTRGGAASPVTFATSGDSLSLTGLNAFYISGTVTATTLTSNTYTAQGNSPVLFTTTDSSGSSGRYAQAFFGGTAAFNDAYRVKIRTAEVDHIGLIVQGKASQTANLQEWQSSTGTALASVSATGAGSFVSLTQNGNNVCDISNNCSYAASSGSTSYIQNGTSIQTNANLAIQSASASSVGAVIRGAAAQTANLQEWQNSTGTVLSAIGSDGSLVLGPNVNHTAVAVSSGNLILGSGSSIGETRLNASGVTYLRLEGSRAAVYIGTGVNGWSAPGTVERLRVSAAPTTVDNLANVIFSTTATTSKGLVIQGLASQTANLQEWQSSTGTALAYVNASGDISTSRYMAVNGATLGAVLSGQTAVLNVNGYAGIDGVRIGGNAILGTGGGRIDLGTNSVSIHNWGFSANALSLGTNYTSRLSIDTLSDYKGLVIRGVSGQTVNLQEWQNNSGSVLTSISSAGYLSSPRFKENANGVVIGGASTPQAGTNVLVESTGGSNRALVVKGYTGQTANLQEWQNSSGTALSYIDSAGSLSINNSAALTGATKLRVKGGTSLSTSGTDGWTLNGVTNGTQFFTSETGSYGSPSVMGMSGEWSSSTVPTLSTYGYMGGYFGARGSGTRILIGSRSEAISLATISGDTVYGSQGLASFENPATATGGTAIGVQGTATTNTSSSGDRHVYGVSGQASSNGANTFAYGGTFTANGTGTNIALRAVSGSATTKGLVVRGASSQSANLQEWQDNTGAALASINGAGNVFTIGSSYTITAGSGNWVFNNNSIQIPSIRQNTGYLQTVGATTILQWSNTVSNGAIEVTSTAATQKGLIVKGAAAQSANLQEWQNSSGTTLASMSASGDLNLLGGKALYSYGTGDPTTADARWGNFYNNGAATRFLTSGKGAYASAIPDMYFDKYDGTTLTNMMMLQSSTGNLGIGTTTIGTNNRLIVNPYSTVDNLATAQVNTNAATNKGLVVQGFASQSANLQEWQNSSGTALARVNAGGQLTATGLVSTQSGSTRDLYFNRSDTGVVKIQSSWGSATAYGVQIQPSSGSITSYASGYGVMIGNVYSSSVTSGNYDILRVYENAFSPASGSSQLSGININPIINQTGTATGITRGLYVNPTLTSAVDFRGVEIANASGYGLYQSGASAVNYLAGVTKIGSNGTAGTVEKFRVNTPTTIDNTAATLLATGGAANKGLVVQGAAGQTANLQEWQNSSGTALQGIGAGGELTKAVKIGSADNAITTNALMSYYSTSGTPYITFASSAANSALYVNNNIDSGWKGLVVRGHSAQTANLQEWQNSSGTVLSSVSSSGAIYAGTSYSFTGDTDTSIYRNGIDQIRMNFGGLDRIQMDNNSVLINNKLAVANSISAGGPTFGTAEKFRVNAPTTIDNSASSILSSSASTDKALVIQGAASQTANIFEVQASNGGVYTSVSAAGLLTSTNITATNTLSLGGGGASTSGAIRLVNTQAINWRNAANGANVYGIAVTSSDVVQLAAPVTTNDSAASVSIGTTAAAKKGLVIQGSAAQTASLQEWQNSSGTVLGSVKSDGSLVVGSGEKYLSAASLTVRGTGVLQTAFINTTGSSSTGGSGIIGIQDDGAATSSGDRLGYILLGGAYDASNNAYHSAGITAFASQDFATGSGGSELRFEVMANGSATRTLRVAIPQGLDGFTFGTSQDTNLYRNGTGILKTNGTLQVGGNISFDPSSYSSFNGTSVSGVVQVTSATATAKGLVVKGAASQSANLQEWQNSSGTALGQVSSDGSMTIGYTGKTFRTLSVIQNTLAGNNDAYSVASFTATGAGDTSQNIAFNATTSSFNFSGAGGLQIQHAYSTTSVNIRSDGTKFGANAVSWNVAPLGQVEVVTASASRKGLVVQGAASQTANLQEWQNSSSTVLLSVGSTGVINSSATGTEHDLGVNLGVRVGTFLRFGGGSGGASTGVVRMFNSNLINWRNAANTGNIGITVNGSDTLQLGAAATTPDALSDTTIGTSATTRKGLVIQGLASQTANLQEWQSSTGTVLASISSAGNLTVVNATVNGTLVVNGASTFNGNITVNGKIITGNASGSTTVTVDTAGAGTGATASISGNDTSGVITINTGTGAAAGKLATITFSAAFPSSPNVVITPKAIPGGGAYPQYHYDSATGTFDLSSFNALTDSSTYTFSYFIVD